MRQTQPSSTLSVHLEHNTKKAKINLNNQWRPYIHSIRPEHMHKLLLYICTCLIIIFLAQAKIEGSKRKDAYNFCYTFVLVSFLAQAKTEGSKRNTFKI